MARKHTKAGGNGFTMMEVVVVIALAGIMTLGAGVLLANGQKDWSRLYGRVYGDTAVDGFAAQKVFDTVCRKASYRKYVLSESGDSLELYYWDATSTASTPDNYVRFYQNDSDVFVEHGTNQTGTWQPDTATATIKIARGVDSLRFTALGTSIQMFMSYTDPNVLPVVCSAVRHND